MNGKKIRITGLVQGVGFRPYVYNLAQELGIAGTVRNDARGVKILACGVRTILDMPMGENLPRIC